MNQLSLHHYFGSSMILQRNAAVTLKGRARPRAGIRVSLHQGDSLLPLESCFSIVKEDGSWSAVLDAREAGGPFKLRLSSEGESLCLSDIYFGDVFILAGQSNMELPLSRCPDKMGPLFDGYEDRLIRELKPALAPVFGREARDWQDGGVWKAATSENTGEMSALGLSFARKYREALNVPVGLIMLAVGGTPIEAWLPPEDLADEPHWAEIESCFSNESYKENLLAAEEESVRAWYSRLEDETRPVVYPNEFDFPKSFIGSKLEDYCGTVWLKKSFDLGEEEVNLYHKGLLRLGSMIDADSVYLNGTFIGETSYRYPPRRYPLPEGVLRPGTNELVVRLMIHRGRGGIVPRLFYGLEASGSRLDLSGRWSFSMGRAMPPMPATTTLHYLPSGLYQGQLAPIRKLPVTGSLWYQGEGNDSRPDNYEARFRQLIRMWKKEFGEKTPFVYAQLSAYEDPAGLIAGDAWAKIREAQRQVEDMPGTAMIVTVDCGERDDLHPQDKWTPGVRADRAMRSLLGRLKDGEVAKGPEIESVSRTDDGQIEVKIRANDESLEFPDNLREAMRVYHEEEKRWVMPEEIKIEDEKILVEGDKIRYNYEAAPVEIQIRNKSGLPLPPFEVSRTDETKRFSADRYNDKSIDA